MMFAFLSNLVTSPLCYVLFFLVLGLVVQHRKWKRGMFGISVVLLCLFTNTPFFRWAEEQWYKEYDRPLPVNRTYRYGIVLGGYSYWDWERGRPEYSEIGDRLFEGIRLYKTGRIGKLVLASDGSIILKKDGKGLQGNPDGMMAYLNELGVPSEDIIMEKYANNTRENVTFTKQLLGDSCLSSDVLLITSAVHMKRSESAFQKEGVFPDCYITDTWVDVKGQSLSYWPSVGTLASWPELLHEWVGYVVYKLRGW